MRLLAIVAERDGVCTRQRVELFEAALRAAGVALEVAELPPSGAGRRALFARSGEADGVLLLRRLLVASDWRRLRRSARRVIYDFDDALWLRDPSRQRSGSWLRLVRLGRMLRSADLVLCGNETLAVFARHYARQVAVVPTCVDTERLTPRDDTGLVAAHDDTGLLTPHKTTNGAERPVVLGWIGSASTANYLKLIESPLRRVAEALREADGAASSADDATVSPSPPPSPGVALKIVSDAFPPLDVAMPVEHKPWALVDELADLQSFDIGLMPLSDDDWSRGKCAFKLLQYGAVGIPSVAHPVGVNAQAIDAGQTGFLARSDDEWAEALRALVADASLRRRLGAAARLRIVERYSAAVWGERYAALICGAIE